MDAFDEPHWMSEIPCVSLRMLNLPERVTTIEKVSDAVPRLMLGNLEVSDPLSERLPDELALKVTEIAGMSE